MKQQSKSIYIKPLLDLVYILETTSAKQIHQSNDIIIPLSQFLLSVEDENIFPKSQFYYLQKNTHFNYIKLLTYRKYISYTLLWLQLQMKEYFRAMAIRITLSLVSGPIIVQASKVHSHIPLGKSNFNLLRTV